MTVDEDCPPGTTTVAEVGTLVDAVRLIDPVEVEEPAVMTTVDDALGDMVTGRLDGLIGVDEPAGTTAVLEECPEQLCVPVDVDPFGMTAVLDGRADGVTERLGVRVGADDVDVDDITALDEARVDTTERDDGVGVELREVGETTCVDEVAEVADEELVEDVLVVEAAVVDVDVEELVVELVVEVLVEVDVDVTDVEVEVGGGGGGHNASAASTSMFLTLWEKTFPLESVLLYDPVASHNITPPKVSGYLFMYLLTSDSMLSEPM
jgi:hypothetical protein